MDRQALLSRFAREFIGLGRVDPVLTLDGSEQTRRRVYLDTTATALMPEVVWRGLEQYLAAASANSHTDAHRAGRDTTKAIEDSRDAIGRLVGYCKVHDVVLFTANGATGATNFLARALFRPELRPVIKRFPDGPPREFVDQLANALGDGGQQAIEELLERPLVVTTAMEHHSNLLPWMEAVGTHNVRVARIDEATGGLDLADLKRILDEEGERVRLVAVTATSNVTGIINPVHEIAAMAHAVGAQIMVDGAQWVPHAKVHMHPSDNEHALDYLVLSGHKLYAPGSRGALIGTLSTLSGRRCVTDVGGGMVEYVSTEDFAIKDEVTAREEAGTPNIPGSIAMGLVAEALMAIGMDTVEDAEHDMTELLVNTLNDVPNVVVYGGDIAHVPRAGVVSFNVSGYHHGLVAAYLNDFHNIAVRNQCFCAQPYVTQLLQCTGERQQQVRENLIHGNHRNIPGMVRASLGVYSTAEDIADLGEALRVMQEHGDQIRELYAPGDDGEYRRKDGEQVPLTYAIADYVQGWAKN